MTLSFLFQFLAAPASPMFADFLLSITLLQVTGVPGVRRCRSASTIGILTVLARILVSGIDSGSHFYDIFMILSVWDRFWKPFVVIVGLFFVTHLP